MELSPQQLCEVEFSEQWRGYSRDQVDDFIERVAAAVSTLQDRLRKMTERAVRAEQRSQEGSDADGAARRTLVLAQRTADATIAEAKDTAARLIAQAQEEARAIILAAEASASSEVVPDAEPTAREEIADLEVTRSRLQANVAALEAHVTDNRARIKGLLDELQLRVDDGLSTHIAQWPSFDNGRVLVDDGVVVDDSAADHVETIDDFDNADHDEPAEAPAAAVAQEPADASEWEPEPELDLEPAPSEQWQPVNLDWERARPAETPPAAVAAVSERHDNDELAVRVSSRAEQEQEFPPHDVDDDTYFAELRGALDDDAPLGPRDDAPGMLRSREDTATAVAEAPTPYDQGVSDGRKFGLLKRRKRRQA